jgi:hypothetical protein
LNKSQALLLFLFVTSLALAFPNAYAVQTTRIYQLVHPSRTVAGGFDPIHVTATVYYNDTTPGNTLAVGILDAEMTPQRVIPGIVTSSPDPCLNQFVLTAFCVIDVKAASGAEQLNFRIGGILGGKRGPGNWNLNVTTALFDANNMLIPKTTSSILFGIELAPVTLKVTVPAAVAVSVDGVRQPPGSAAVGVALGEHNITVPSLVQLNPTTRLRFDHWPDGSTNMNRTILVTGDTSFDVAYVIQNLLTITGPQPNSSGAGWYDEGTTATFSVPRTEPMGGLLGILGGKLNFQGWYENGQLLTRSTTGAISMNQPHMITAAWQGDYSEPTVILPGIIIILAFAYLMARRTKAKPTRRRSHRRRKLTKRRS